MKVPGHFPRDWRERSPNLQRWSNFDTVNEINFRQRRFIWILSNQELFVWELHRH